MQTQTLKKTIDIHIFEATEADCAAIRDIYEYYVLRSIATFEEEVPTLEEMVRRFYLVKDRNLPYLVAKKGETLIGYAYALPYHPRHAYRYTVQDSIYVHPHCLRRGVGASLLKQLIHTSKQARMKEMIALIAQKHTHASGSIELHQQFGFKTQGCLERVGYKFEQWIDTYLLQLHLDNAL